MSWISAFIFWTLWDRAFISSSSATQLLLTLSIVFMLAWLILDDSSDSAFMAWTLSFNSSITLESSSSLVTLSCVSWACELVTSAMPVIVCATSSIARSVCLERSSNEVDISSTLAELVWTCPISSVVASIIRLYSYAIWLNSCPFGSGLTNFAASFLSGGCLIDGSYLSILFILPEAASWIRFLKISIPSVIQRTEAIVAITIKMPITMMIKTVFLNKAVCSVVKSFLLTLANVHVTLELLPLSK